MLYFLKWLNRLQPIYRVIAWAKNYVVREEYTIIRLWIVYGDVRGVRDRGSWWQHDRTSRIYFMHEHIAAYG